ncbi:MAG: response regulator [Desulfobacula sp.]|nr:response regulator [Desulfobacula sp.]
MRNSVTDFDEDGSNNKLAGMAQIFQLLGTDCKKNIAIIVEQTCQILDGICSFYNRIDDKHKSLIIRAGHNQDLNIKNHFDKEGHICWEATIKGKDKPVILPDLENTIFFETDPYVKKYNLKSYLGFPIRLNNTAIGSLCVFYTKKRQFSDDEIHIIQMLAAALSLEEERIRDISRVKDLEAKLLRAEKMELIGTMAGGVAHDLNNILSGLVSYPELILMQLPDNSPLKEPISFMHDAGLRAADIVQDLLTLTRRGIPVENIFNLNNVVQEYLQSAAHTRLERNYPGIRFKTDSETDLLNICGSPSHISKIVMNLVINAAEAIKDNGIVKIKSYNQYIDIPLGGYDTIQEGDYAVLRITDDGGGIPQKDLNRIFEPFYTKKQMGRSGSGLGLSVVWNCVKDHQGYIEVRSTKNIGTVFELYFPATRKDLGNIPDNFEIESFKGNGETILVIDDIEEQRKIARDSLKLLGYTPFSVASGEKAIAFIKNNPVDLLLLDMKMEPGIDGLETYSQIKRFQPNQKAIIASGFSQSRRVKETLRLGAGQYIKKPYTFKKLARAIKKELLNSAEKMQKNS